MRTKAILTVFFWLLLIALSILILLNTLPYFTIHSAISKSISINELESKRISFLLSKGELLNNVWWRLAFYMHITGALICLFTGLFQFSGWIIKKYRSWHKWLGKIYVVTVVFLAWPGGQFMSFFSNGGILAVIPFACLGVLWIVTTIKGYLCIKRKNLVEHRKWMIRSYAVAVSAITFRLFQLMCYYFFELEPVTNYIVSLWLSFVLNVIFGEIIVYYSLKSKYTFP